MPCCEHLEMACTSEGFEMLHSLMKIVVVYDNSDYTIVITGFLTKSCLFEMRAVCVTVVR